MVVPSAVASRLDGLDAPVKLVEWWPNHSPADELLWKDGYGHQCSFVLDTLGSMLIKGIDGDPDDLIELIKNSIWVISTHHSKSVKLPVFRLKHPTKGIELVMRNNFYDWKVTVVSDEPIVDNFYDLFNKTEKIDAVYCEGFDAAWVFGPYAKNQQQFTIEIGNDYALFTFFWLLMGSLKH